MGAWRIVVGLVWTVAFMVFAVAVYYGVSLLVLTVTGRVLPLAGRRRKR